MDLLDAQVYRCSKVGGKVSGEASGVRCRCSGPAYIYVYGCSKVGGKVGSSAACVSRYAVVCVVCVVCGVCVCVCVCVHLFHVKVSQRASE